jgi:hypothetical protein
MTVAETRAAETKAAKTRAAKTKAEAVIYFDHAVASAQTGFRAGDAGFVVSDEQWGFRGTSVVEIPPNALHALESHGVVEQLNALEFQAQSIAPGVDAVLRPHALDAAAHVLYEADRKTYGRTWEFVVERDGGTEYRIVIDNRGYQRTLSQLQFLVTSASRQGFGVRIGL